MPEAFSLHRARSARCLLARTTGGLPPASMPVGESRKAPGSWSSIPMWKSQVDSWARSSPDSINSRTDPVGPPGIVGFGLRNPDGSPQGSVGVFPNLARTIREQFIPRYSKEIPGRLANSFRSGRLGHRCVHAGELSDDRCSSGGWTRISSFITKKSPSAARPSTGLAGRI